MFPPTSSEQGEGKEFFWDPDPLCGPPRLQGQADAHPLAKPTKPPGPRWAGAHGGVAGPPPRRPLSQGPHERVRPVALSAPTAGARPGKRGLAWNRRLGPRRLTRCRRRAVGRGPGGPLFPPGFPKPPCRPGRLPGAENFTVALAGASRRRRRPRKPDPPGLSPLGLLPFPIQGVRHPRPGPGPAAPFRPTRRGESHPRPSQGGGANEGPARRGRGPRSRDGRGGVGPGVAGGRAPPPFPRLI